MSTIVHSREIYKSVNDIDRANWDKLVADKNIYLSFNYLKAIEDSMSDSVTFIYAISFDIDHQPLLISAFQILKFIDKRKHKGNKLYCIVSAAKSRLFTFNLMVCGNVYSNGENGFISAPNLTQEETIKELLMIANTIETKKAFNINKPKIILIKEFWASNNHLSFAFKKNKFREFMIDVNMVLPIDSEWQTVDNYKDSLKSKYRTRFNSVFKKATTFSVKALSTEDIRKNANRIDALFTNVTDRSNFSVGQLTANSFFELKQNLRDKFFVRGLFDNDYLVGFSTGTYNGNVLEANYVGLDYDYNQSNAIYQRLLYDYIEQAILSKSTELHLGRTSELIKSAIGAVPENMNLYAKHNSIVINKLLKPIFHFISPSKFELRQPFKTKPNN